MVAIYNFRTPDYIIINKAPPSPAWRKEICKINLRCLQMLTRKEENTGYFNVRGIKISKVMETNNAEQPQLPTCRAKLNEN